jgi:hypothetical protein
MNIVVNCTPLERLHALGAAETVTTRHGVQTGRLHKRHFM